MNNISSPLRDMVLLIVCHGNFQIGRLTVRSGSLVVYIYRYGYASTCWRKHTSEIQIGLFGDLKSADDFSCGFCCNSHLYIHFFWVANAIIQANK